LLRSWEHWLQVAIPAFNEYRKSAKKAAYRTDLSSLHKGWLAFGVEIDSFCDRDTEPRAVSIQNIGMQSILTSKLYGDRSPGANAGVCSDNASNTSATCATASGDWIEIVANNAPGKHNFIGFGAVTCGTVAAPVNNIHQILGEEGTTATTHDANCDLGVAEYEMGVFGHVSGVDYFGVSINNNGILSQESEAPVASNTADSNCS